MSSTGQPTSSTSNVQIIIDVALADYTQITGTDLSKTPFAVALEQSNSPEVVLQLLQEREKAFKEYRDGNSRLMKCVSFAVKLIQPFSRIIRKALSQVSRTCHPMTLLTVDSSDPLPTNECSVCRHRFSPCCMSLEFDFNRVPCDELVCQAASGVTSSYDALVELFECLGKFLKRLEIYTTIPPTPLMTEVIVNIMVELLSVLALASKQIKQGGFSKYALTYIVHGLMCHREIHKKVAAGERDRGRSPTTGSIDPRR